MSVVWDAPADLRPDLPGRVHGIVSLHPPTVQCDGCGVTASGPDLAIAVLCGGIQFDGGHGDPRRLCRACRKRAGWRDD